MFERLTAFLPKLNIESYGKWNEQAAEADGSAEHPYQWPFVIYDKVVNDFIDEVYSFVESYPDMELNHYSAILEKSGIDWSLKEMQITDVSSLEGKTVMALIVGAIRAERFCDGALLDFLENGSITKWLERLYEIDNGKRS